METEVHDGKAGVIPGSYTVGRHMMVMLRSAAVAADSWRGSRGSLAPSSGSHTPESRWWSVLVLFKNCISLITIMTAGFVL